MAQSSSTTSLLQPRLRKPVFLQPVWTLNSRPIWVDLSLRVVWGARSQIRVSQAPTPHCLEDPVFYLQWECLKLMDNWLTSPVPGTQQSLNTAVKMNWTNGGRWSHPPSKSTDAREMLGTHQQRVASLLMVLLGRAFPFRIACPINHF